MNDNKKKGLVYSIISVATLIVLVVGATYAYFSVTSGNGSSTLITATTPQVDNVAIEQIKSELHLNLLASDMSLANKGEYYATSDDSLRYVGEKDKLHEILKVTASGEETYTCSGEIVVKLDITKDSMGSVLEAGDMYLYLSGNTKVIEKGLDLSTLK